MFLKQKGLLRPTSERAGKGEGGEEVVDERVGGGEVVEERVEEGGVEDRIGGGGVNREELKRMGNRVRRELIGRVAAIRVDRRIREYGAAEKKLKALEVVDNATPEAVHCQHNSNWNLMTSS